MAFGFIGQNVGVDTELKRQILTYYDLSNQFGPAWEHRIENVYFTSPKNLLVGYWPSFQQWAHSLPADFYMPAEEYVWIADNQHNPERETVWTGLFFDIGSNTWMVSAETPVDLHGGHIATIGNDILLGDLIVNTIENTMPGAYNVMFRADGRLIAHPLKIEDIKKTAGDYDIRDSQDELLMSIFRTVVSNNSEEVALVSNQGDPYYLATYLLEGPEWYMVTVYPRHLITASAFSIARYVLLLGLLSLVIEIAVLIWVLKSQVSTPLYALAKSVNDVAAGNYDIQIDDQRTDELGVIGRSIKTLAQKVKQRQLQDAEINKQLEQKVNERTKALRIAKNEAEYANRRKTEFLSQMSHDLRTPLNSIIGYAQLLENRQLNTQDFEYLQKFIKSSWHLKELIDKLLDVSILESGNITFELENFNVVECIEECISMVKTESED